MACVHLTLPLSDGVAFLYCFLVAPRPVCLGTLPDLHCWHAEIWNSIPVSNWSFTQSFCYWLSVISDAEISVIFCRLFSLTMHGCMVVGMAACCAAGVGARGSLMLPGAQKRAMPLTINIANSIYLYGKA